MVGMLVHRRVTRSIKFAGTQLHIWVERGRVLPRTQARARTRTARPGVDRTNHFATAPLPHGMQLYLSAQS